MHMGKRIFTMALRHSRIGKIWLNRIAKRIAITRCNKAACAIHDHFGISAGITCNDSGF
ncbi:hypothetical protein D3C80_2132190 [compost metagenome]